jgi:orotidine-5'-phosphate decarboxylase
MGFDSITVNPLMGWDCVEPFCRDAGKGVFLLCLTSNPGADDFLLPGELYLKIAERAQNKWNANGNVGLVVGATRPELASRVREVAPDLPFLIPGVGAQGGSLTETLDAIRGRDAGRFLINASRTIMYPATDGAGKGWLTRVEEGARQLRDSISSALA